MWTKISPFASTLADLRPPLVLEPVISRCNGNTPLRLVVFVEAGWLKSAEPVVAPTVPNGTGYTALSSLTEPVIPLTHAFEEKSSRVLEGRLMLAYMTLMFCHTCLNFRQCSC